MASLDIDSALRARMDRLGLTEADLVESFVLGSGPGGQKINKTSSCVSLRHLPTGLEVQCQEGRSQAHNRILARIRLCDKVEDEQRRAALTAAAERARERFRKRRRSQAQKARLIEFKRRRSEKKSRRARPD